MKILIRCLLCFSIFVFVSSKIAIIEVAPVEGRMSIVIAGGGEEPSYIGCTGADWCEDCESGSYYYGFDGKTETDGTIGEYTGAYKYGAKAIEAIVGFAGSGEASVVEEVATGAQNTLWTISTFWITSLADWKDKNYIIVHRFYTAGCSSPVARVEVAYDGADYTLMAYHGTFSSNPKTTSLSTNTAYVLKTRYIAGSGSDGQLDVWIKEAEGSYTAEIDINHGTSTDGAGCIKNGIGYHAWANDATLVIDDIGYDDDGDPDP